MPEATTNSRQNHYDLLIVGGGPGGAAAGVVAANAGLSTLIVEKDRYPRDKPCAGGISPRCVRDIDQIFGPDALPSFQVASSTGVRLYHSQDLVGEADGCDEMFYARRRDMDAALVDIARGAGCEVMEGAKVVDVRGDEGQVVLASGQTVSGSVIVGADGVSSAVRRSLFGPRRKRRKFLGLGLCADMPVDELRDDDTKDVCSRVPHIDFGAVSWGCGWVFPQGDHVSIGLGASLRWGTDCRRALQSFVNAWCRPGAWERLRVRGHLLAWDTFRRGPGVGHVLLIGDAACLDEPITGEGISFAIESGKFAAQAAAAALSSGPPDSAGARYNQAMRAEILPYLKQAAWARWLLYPAPCLRLAVRSLKRHPRLVRLYMEILAGNMSYAEYFKRMFRERR